MATRVEGLHLLDGMSIGQQQIVGVKVCALECCWGGHWRQRIGVEIARGVARCVEKAATGGWVGSGNSRGHSHEYDRDCC